MALPTLDATFASAADLPRRMMLAQWLVNIQYSGSVADYATLPERYLWAKIAVAAGGPKTEADYISLPNNYIWKAIYDAVSETSNGLLDWNEKRALGHIAAAYRGDTANPANLATYIDWPWRYQVASIIATFSEVPEPQIPSNVFAFWELNDNGSGGLGLIDSSGNGYDLTKFNSPVLGFGKINGCAVLNGSSDYFRASAVGISTNNLSVSFWFKGNSQDAYSQIIRFEPISGGNDFGIFINFGTSNNFLYIYDGSSTYGGNINIADNEWHHAVVTLNSSGNLLAYIDGNSTPDISQSIGQKTINFSSIYIGVDYLLNSDTYLEGNIDALAVWDRVLSIEEISDLWNNGNGLEP